MFHVEHGNESRSTAPHQQEHLPFTTEHTEYTDEDLKKFGFSVWSVYSVVKKGPPCRVFLFRPYVPRGTYRKTNNAAYQLFITTEHTEYTEEVMKSG